MSLPYHTIPEHISGKAKSRQVCHGILKSVLGTGCLEAVELPSLWFKPVGSGRCDTGMAQEPPCFLT